MKGLRTKRVNTIKEGTLIVAIDIGMASNLTMGVVLRQTGAAPKHSNLTIQEKDSIDCGTWYLRVKPDFDAMR